MTDAPALIDLGEDRAAPQVDGAAPAAPHRRRLGAVIAVAALALTAGSAPVVPPISEVRVPAGLGDEITVSPDRLYVVQPDSVLRDAGRRSVSAYRLPTGRPLWRTPLPLAGRVRQVIPAPAALLVSLQQEGDVVTAALDPGTGRLLWRMAYEPVGLTGGGALMIAFSGTGGPDPDPARVLALEPATGRIAWSYQVPIDAWHSMDLGRVRGQRARSVTAEPSGRMTVRDLDTGRVLATTRLASPPAGNQWFQTVGGLLLAADGDQVSAYALPTLDLRWTAPLNLAGGFVSANCAGQLCVFGQLGGLRVVDPRTGRVRWSDTRWQAAETIGGRLLAYAWATAQTPAQAAVLDPATGRELFDLRRWTAVAQPEPAGQSTAVVHIEPATAKAWLGVVDLAARTVRVLGSVDGISGDCRGAPNLVVCRRLDASVGVWRI